MTRASSVRRVENALRAVPGVTSAAVNLATERATVEGAGADFRRSPARCRRRLHGGGCRCRAEAAAMAARKAPGGGGRLTRDVIIAAMLTVPILILGMGLDWLPTLYELMMERTGMHPLDLTQFVLTTLLLAGPDFRFFRLGIPALLRLAPDTNSLVAVGTGA